MPLSEVIGTTIGLAIGTLSSIVYVVNYGNRGGFGTNPVILLSSFTVPPICCYAIGSYIENKK